MYLDVFDDRYVHIHLYVYICVYTCIYIHILECEFFKTSPNVLKNDQHLYVYIHVHTYVYTSMLTFVCICIHEHKHMCTYISICVYIDYRRT